MLTFLSVERILNAARGRAGGKAGAKGKLSLEGPTGITEVPGKCTLRVNPGETLIVETPGGGGYGDPAARTAEALSRDIDDGFVTGGV
jgi:N-methylhydantoinase B